MNETTKRRRRGASQDTMKCSVTTRSQKYETDNENKEIPSIDTENNITNSGEENIRPIIMQKLDEISKKVDLILEKVSDSNINNVVPEQQLVNNTVENSPTETESNLTIKGSKDDKSDVQNERWTANQKIKAINEIINSSWDPGEGKSMSVHFAEKIHAAKPMFTEWSEKFIVDSIIRQFSTWHQTLRLMWSKSKDATITSAFEFVRAMDDIGDKEEDRARYISVANSTVTGENIETRPDYSAVSYSYNNHEQPRRYKNNYAGTYRRRGRGNYRRW